MAPYADPRGGGREENRLAYPQLRSPLPVAFALVAADQGLEPDVFDGVGVGMSTQGIVIDAAIPSNVYHSLLTKRNRCAVSFKDAAGLPDMAMGHVTWAEWHQARTGNFCRLEIAFKACPDEDREQIRMYVHLHCAVDQTIDIAIPEMPHQPPPQQQEERPYMERAIRVDQDQPNQIEMDTIRELSAYLGEDAEGNQRTGTRYNPMVLSLPVTFAVAFPEYTNQPVVREGKVVSLNSRGALIDAGLSRGEYRAILQKYRKCCVKFQNQPDLPEMVQGKTVMIRPLSRDEKNQYRLGVVYHGITEDQKKRIQSFFAKIYETAAKIEDRHRPMGSERTPTVCRRPTPPRPARFTLSLPVAMAIVLPEVSPLPQVYPAIIGDLNERGAMLQVDLPYDIYRALLQANRDGFIVFGKDMAGLPDSISGSVVWIQPEQVNGKTSYKLGMRFGKVTPEAAQRIRDFVARTCEEVSVPDIRAERPRMALDDLLEERRRMPQTPPASQRMPSPQYVQAVGPDSLDPFGPGSEDEPTPRYTEPQLDDLEFARPGRLPDLRLPPQQQPVAAQAGAQAAPPPPAMPASPTPLAVQPGGFQQPPAQTAWPQQQPESAPPQPVQQSAQPAPPLEMQPPVRTERTERPARPPYQPEAPVRVRMPRAMVAFLFFITLLLAANLAVMVAVLAPGLVPKAIRDKFQSRPAVETPAQATPTPEPTPETTPAPRRRPAASPAVTPTVTTETLQAISRKLMLPPRQ